MSLSIIIPARNEDNNILKTVNCLLNVIKNKFRYEIIIIDDFSSDNTYNKIISAKKKNVSIYRNKEKGIGGAINLGILKSRMKYLCFVMADLSDSPKDLIKYYSIIQNSDFDAIFGSRFIKNSSVKNYPKLKLFLNRCANILIKILLFSNYNDFTNAFKIYKKDTINKIKPFNSKSFEIFLEIPLKFIYKKFKYKIIPISWIDRTQGTSNFKINELSFKYIKTFLGIFLYKFKI
jgi:dolichol-phosphate mannosyltransferase